MLIIGVAGTTLSDEEKAWLRAPNVSGVILFARNTGSRDEVIALVEAIREAGGEDMLVCVDQEGGRVQRLREGFTRLPPLSALGAVYDRDPAEAVRLAEEHAWVMASELRATGIDFSFAPVLDLARGSAAIGNRAFHADPAVVGELGQAYVRGMHLAGMAAVLKHFPGHGHASGDSHQGGVVTPPLADLQGDDLIPYQTLTTHAPVAVMVGHMQVPGLTGDDPASLSTAAYGLLRSGEYGGPGFGGLVFTDDLSSMGAINERYGVADAVLKSLQAGADVALWVTTKEVPAVLDRLEKAVAAGELDMAKVDESVLRVAAVKGPHPRCG